MLKYTAQEYFKHLPEDIRDIIIERIRYRDIDFILNIPGSIFTHQHDPRGDQSDNVDILEDFIGKFNEYYDWRFSIKRYTNVLDSTGEINAYEREYVDPRKVKPILNQLFENKLVEDDICLAIHNMEIRVKWTPELHKMHNITPRVCFYFEFFTISLRKIS